MTSAARSVIYMPEDGQTFDGAQANGNKKLFGTSYNYKSYSVFWRKEDDEKARSTLKALRIRPIGRDIEPSRAPGRGDAGSLDDGFSCLVSTGAHRKLMDAGLVALGMLYD